ncbi:hypothetical protein [Oryza sativa Japonica Group]|uniref:Uncharacterized protein B1096D03.20 n=2 Tax=Oryza TaxID=4527 RepID=Q5VPY6_ORYSJ|nr:hypothetical protein [Oryza sativa Japonica Group]
MASVPIPSLILSLSLSLSRRPSYSDSSALVPQMGGGNESFGVVLLEMLTGRRSMDKKRPAGFGYVFKGWIDPNITSPAKLGTDLTVVVRSLEQDALQGHREWVDYGLC